MIDSVFKRYIRPTGTSLVLQECLYGFIMSFIIITAAKVGLMTFESKKELILVILGMNVTWGVIDAIMYYWMNVLDQRENMRLFSSMEGISESEAVDLLMDSFEGTAMDLIDETEERKICEEIVKKGIEPPKQIMWDRKRLLKGSLGCFVVTVLTLVPILIPIALIPDIFIAMDVASFVSSTLLFFVGFFVGKYIAVNGWILGIVLAAVTWAVSIVSAFTGG